MVRSRQKHAIFLEFEGVLTAAPKLAADGTVPWKPDVLKCLAAIDPRDFLLIVASNREDVGLGRLKEREFKKFTDAFEREARDAGVHFSKIYTSPWHPKAKPKWRKESVFRKPAPGMFKIAQQEFELGLSRSWVLANCTRDVVAGDRGNVGTVLITEPGQIMDTEYVVEAHHDVRSIREGLRYIHRFEAALRC